MSRADNLNGGELLKVADPWQKHRLFSDYYEVAQAAYATGGRRALELPAPRTTAAHEAGHAVLHATTGPPPYQVAIWYVPVANGYAGENSFAPDAPAVHIDTRTEPRRALVYAANLLAGPLAELARKRNAKRWSKSACSSSCTAKAGLRPGMKTAGPRSTARVSVSIARTEPSSLYCRRFSRRKFAKVWMLNSWPLY